MEKPNKVCHDASHCMIVHAPDFHRSLLPNSHGATSSTQGYTGQHCKTNGRRVSYNASHGMTVYVPHLMNRCTNEQLFTFSVIIISFGIVILDHISSNKRLPYFEDLTRSASVRSICFALPAQSACDCIIAFTTCVPHSCIASMRKH